MNLDQLCLSRLKSADFGYPKSRPQPKRHSVLGFMLFAMLTVAYLIVGGGV